MDEETLAEYLIAAYNDGGRPIGWATVWRTPRPDAVEHGDPGGPGYHDSFYFCCHECGACGRRWTGQNPAGEEAMRHLIEVHGQKALPEGA